MAPADRLCDTCDACGRRMEMTGDALCRACHEDDEARFVCLCGRPVIFADTYCSIGCEDAANRLLVGEPRT